MLRQLLLNLAAYALVHAVQSPVVFTLLAGTETGLETVFTTKPEIESSSLKTCSALAAALGVRLVVERRETVVRLALAWPLPMARSLVVVDDNPGLIDLYRRYLAGAGWQVIGSGSAAEARQRLDEALYHSGPRPDALLLDIMLPGEDGWQLLDALKKDPAWHDLPVIICSVISDSQMAFTLGAAGCLAKPVSQKDLIDALKKITTM
jgi:CheY-like chemotaxis protein